MERDLCQSNPDSSIVGSTSQGIPAISTCTRLFGQKPRKSRFVSASAFVLSSPTVTSGTQWAGQVWREPELLLQEE